MSPLKIENRPGFRAAVLTGLHRLCPALTLTIDAAGVVKRVGFACQGYCGHAAACNLITSLMDHPDPTHVHESTGGNSYRSKISTAFWKPTTHVRRSKQLCGGSDAPALTILSHELIHAWRDRSGVYQGASTTLEEFPTVRAENQVRAGLCIQPLVTYGRYPIPDYRQGTLPVDDREMCACDSLEEQIRQAARQLTCSFTLGLQCANDVLDSILTDSFAGVGRQSFPESPVERATMNQQLREKIEIAGHTRAAAPHRPIVERELTGLVQWDLGVVLESVDLDGAYRAVVITVRDNELRVVTNLTVTGDKDRYVRGPGILVEWRAVGGKWLTEIRARLDAIEFQDGDGGDLGVSDGSVQFLTVQRGEHRMVTSLFGYLFPAFDGDYPPPPGVDQARWAAVDEVLNILRFLLLNVPGSLSEPADE